MSGIGLFPKNSVVVGKSTQNVTIKKQVILSCDRWVQSNNLYCYIINDSDITMDTVVFIRSYKECRDIIENCGIMVLYPEVSSGKLRIYAKNVPDESITCDYVLCTESKMIGTDEASQLKYHDTHNIGVETVQDALDLLLSNLNNKQ